MVAKFLGTYDNNVAAEEAYKRLQNSVIKNIMENNNSYNIRTTKFEIPHS